MKEWKKHTVFMSNPILFLFTRSPANCFSACFLPFSKALCRRLAPAITYQQQQKPKADENEMAV